MFPGKIPETNPRKFEILGIPGLEQRLVPRKSAAAHLVQLAGPRILILGHRSPRRAELHESWSPCPVERLGPPAARAARSPRRSEHRVLLWPPHGPPKEESLDFLIS